MNGERSGIARDAILLQRQQEKRLRLQYRIVFAGMVLLFLGVAGYIFFGSETSLRRFGVESEELVVIEPGRDVRVASEAQAPEVDQEIDVYQLVQSPPMEPPAADSDSGSGSGSDSGSGAGGQDPGPKDDPQGQSGAAPAVAAPPKPEAQSEQSPARQETTGADDTLETVVRQALGSEDDRFFVQVGSYLSQIQADNARDAFADRYPDRRDRIVTQKVRIDQIDRFRVHFLEKTRQSAESWCQQLKAGGIDCIALARPQNRP